MTFYFEVITGFDNESEHSAKDFMLYQNNPNPFNPSTKINWQSPIGSWQTLKAYGLTENEVVTLINEYRNAGRYEVEFNSQHTTNS